MLKKEVAKGSGGRVGRKLGIAAGAKVRQKLIELISR